VPTEDMEIIQTMPVKSIITSPETGSKIGDRKKVRLTWACLEWQMEAVARVDHQL
jgi:hypothetical protein